MVKTRTVCGIFALSAALAAFIEIFFFVEGIQPFSSFNTGVGIAIGIMLITGRLKTGEKE